MNECTDILKYFNKVTIDDTKLISKYLNLTNYEECNYNIITLMTWLKVYPLYEYHEDDFMILMVYYHDKLYMFMPLCIKDKILMVISKAKDLLDKCHISLSMTCVTNDVKDIILSEYSDGIVYEARDSYDYIYELEKFSEFKGKKLQKKRNHLNNFYKLYHDRYQYQNIDDNNIEELIEYINNQVYLDDGLSFEQEGIIDILKNYQNFDFKAGIIKIDGKIEAYIILSKLSDNMLQENVEKASREYVGLSQAIIYEFFRYNKMNYRWLNREDDMGLENLRKSKLSYNPAYLTKKYYIDL